MAVEKIVTLCKEGDSTHEYYPNIKADNIPSKAISENKLDDNLQEKINRTYPDVYTKTETNALLNTKANANDVYTKTETNTLLNAKANVSDVYTKAETDTLLEDKADKNNILFENIKDKDGHLRFIDGDAQGTQLSGITYSYAKWSLSGSHLLIVVTGTIVGGTTLPSSDEIMNANLPKWILDKIIPFDSVFVGGGSIWISEDGFSQTDTANCYIAKGSDRLYATAYPAKQITNTSYFRLAIDLLIDNA